MPLLEVLEEGAHAGTRPPRARTSAAGRPCAFSALWKPASVAHTGLGPETSLARASSERTCSGSGERAARVGVDVADVQPRALVADRCVAPSAPCNDGPRTGSERRAGCALGLAVQLARCRRAARRPRAGRRRSGRTRWAPRAPRRRGAGGRRRRASSSSSVPVRFPGWPMPKTKRMPRDGGQLDRAVVALVPVAPLAAPGCRRRRRAGAGRPARRGVDDAGPVAVGGVVVDDVRRHADRVAEGGGAAGHRAVAAAAGDAHTEQAGHEGSAEGCEAGACSVRRRTAARTRTRAARGGRMFGALGRLYPCAAPDAPPRPRPRLPARPARRRADLRRACADVWPDAPDRDAALRRGGDRRALRRPRGHAPRRCSAWAARQGGFRALLPVYPVAARRLSLDGVDCVLSS